MKKIEVKGLIIPILLIIFESITYFFVKQIQGTPITIGTNIDIMIPFNTLFIIPYYIWYILLLAVPYYFYNKDTNTLNNYTVSYILCVIISSIIFIIYPTTVIRPEIAGTNLLSIMTEIIYKSDTPINCFPSMHCEISMLFILYILDCKSTPKDIKMLTIITSILIMLSTLFIKQHVFIDLLGGVIIATIVYFITKIITKKISTN